MITVNENKDKHIHNALDGIEPAAGAKERMLNNIKKKAAAQQEIESVPQSQQKPKVISLAKITKWALPIAACFALLIVGIKFMPNLFDSPSSVDPNPGVQVPTPIVAVESAKEIAEQLNIEMDAPVGSDNVQYSIIDGEIAEIQFTQENCEYIFRASAQSGDFSGLSGDEVNTEQIDAKNNALMSAVFCGEEQYYKVTWTDGKITYYVFSAVDDAEKMKAVYELVK